MSNQEICKNLDSRAVQNCIYLLTTAKGRYPDINMRGLKYSLYYLAENHKAIKSSDCKSAGSPPAITNPCALIFNDVESRFKCTPSRRDWHCNRGSYPNRSNGYYINLCENKIEKFYLNRGTGTSNTFTDRPNKRSTVLGAFVTDSKQQDFYPATEKSIRDYAAERRRGNRAKKVRLFGLHSTNNKTDHMKHFHTSPYYSSHGCPSTGFQNQKYLDLVSQSNTVFVNYGPDKFHPVESINKCDAYNSSESDRPSRPANRERRS